MDERKPRTEDKQPRKKRPSKYEETAFATLERICKESKIEQTQLDAARMILQAHGRLGPPKTGNKHINKAINKQLRRHAPQSRKIKEQQRDEFAAAVPAPPGS